MGLIIETSPSSGGINDAVEITIDSGSTITSFNTPYTSNIVTFNGIVATILSGTSTQLNVLVPIGATTGGVEVELSELPDDETDSVSDSIAFTVVYDDDIFPVSEPEPFAKGVINNKVKTVGVTPSRESIYNRDLAYTNFIEVPDENSMIQNVYSIILTQKGEKLFNEEFGTTIDELVFNLTAEEDVLEEEIIDEIITAVNRWEPRVAIIRDNSFVQFDVDTNEITVILSIRVPDGTVRELGVTLDSLNNALP